MPEHCSNDLVRAGRAAHSRTTSNLRGADVQALLDQCRDCPTQTWPPGAILLAEGERSGRLLVLARGTVEVFRDAVGIALIDEPGAVFGEMAVLLDQPHTASVRATTAVVTHVVPEPASFLAERPEVARLIAILLARRLRNVTDYLVDLKRQFAAEAGHLGIVDEVLQSLAHEQGEEFVPAEKLPREPGN